jgi:hypothetical protein
LCRRGEDEVDGTRRIVAVMGEPKFRGGPFPIRVFLEGTPVWVKGQLFLVSASGSFCAFSGGGFLLGLGFPSMLVSAWVLGGFGPTKDSVHTPTLGKYILRCEAEPFATKCAVIRLGYKVAACRAFSLIYGFPQPGAGASTTIVALESVVVSNVGLFDHFVAVQTTESAGSLCGLVWGGCMWRRRRKVTAHWRTSLGMR